MLPNWGEFFSHHNKSALATFFFFAAMEQCGSIAGQLDGVTELLY